MPSVDIASEVRDFVITSFLFGKADRLTDDDSLLDNGVIDSTGVLELVSFVQDRFDIEIESDEIIPANLDSIHNLVEYIGRKTRSNS
jgi:acyl carrier protein